MQAGGQRFDSAHLHHSVRIGINNELRRRSVLRPAMVFDKVNREYPKRFDAGAIVRNLAERGFGRMKSVFMRDLRLRGFALQATGFAIKRQG